MTTIVRQKVSGKRRRFQQEGYDLDLTFITDKIVAMSFPASTWGEKIYRNNINEVAKFFNTKYPHEYLICNMSNRQVDTAKFNNKVISYPWEDHHSPSLTVLFQSCNELFKFMNANRKNIVVINCNAGKGRTGSCISCLLIYTGLSDNFTDAMTYYGWKRFYTGRGVT